MSELGGKRRYVRLTEGQILVRPGQKRVILAESDARAVGISQLMRELIDFGITLKFFSPDALTSEKLPEK